MLICFLPSHFGLPPPSDISTAGVFLFRGGFCALACVRCQKAVDLWCTRFYVNRTPCSPAFPARTALRARRMSMRSCPPAERPCTLPAFKMSKREACGAYRQEKHALSVLHAPDIRRLGSHSGKNIREKAETTRNNFRVMQNHPKDFQSHSHTISTPTKGSSPSFCDDFDAIRRISAGTDGYILSFVCTFAPLFYQIRKARFPFWIFLTKSSNIKMNEKPKMNGSSEKRENRCRTTTKSCRTTAKRKST